MNTVSEYRKNGSSYIRYKVGEKSIIYEQLYSKSVHYFEVFELRIQKGGERWGKVYEDKIRIPGNEDFGKWAWVFRSEKDALKKFNELETKINKKYENSKQ